MNTIDAAFSVEPNPDTTSDLIKNSSTSSFQADVIDQSSQVPVLVDFWAPWCGPCRQLGPSLEKIVSQAGGKVRLVKINIDENQELASQMGVRSIPAVFAFSGGQPVDGFMGALPESEISAFVQKILSAAPADQVGDDMNAQVSQALVSATEALDAGQPEQAINIFGLILQQFPENSDALIGLGRAFVMSGTLEQARQTLDLVPEEMRSSDAYLAVLRSLSLAEEATELNGSDELEMRLTANPDDHQARMDLAMSLNANGQREEAGDALIQIIKRDREWNEGAARTKLLEFFEAWGVTDLATISCRKSLSRLLFS